MKNYVFKSLNYIISFALIMLALTIGNLIQEWLELSVPGSVLGMLILFFAMAFGLVKVQWVQPGASLFIRFMVFLFVPISVGLMDHFDMLLDNALPILASTLGGTLLVLITLSWLLNHMLTRKDA